MKIYSWNIWFRNADIEEALAFIRDAQFDVFCIQEVPAELLPRLQALPFHIYSAPEEDRIEKGVIKTRYIMILSRFPFASTGTIPLTFWGKTLKLRTKIFYAALVRLGLWSWTAGNRHAIYADLETPQGVVRVINLHLFLVMAPALRAQEFDAVMQDYSRADSTVVCGDFNTIESLIVAPLNWIFGGTLADSLWYKRERARLEDRFASYNLHNPLRGKQTHPISRSQLDHILVSKHFKVIKDEVLPDAVGSDHHPVIVEVSP